MRRKDRQMPQEFAFHISDICEWATLSMVDSNNMPYSIPITIARKDNVIYFHSAKEGRKISILNINNSVCISCVGKTFRTPYDFTTEFESAIIFGKALEVLEDSEKIEALKLICLRHTPTNMAEFDAAIKRSLQRTAVWKVEIAEITGKRKKFDHLGKEMKFGRME